MVYKGFKWLSHKLQNHCIYCQSKTLSEIFGLCPTCKQQLLSNANRCKRCAILLVGEQTVCGQCLKKPPEFDKSTTLCSYHSDISHQCVFGVKQDDTAWLRACAELLAHKNIKNQQTLDAIVPIPTHWQKLFTQNNNHSLLLAKRLAKELSLPLYPSALKQIKATQAQKTLSAKARLANMRGAFLCQQNIKGQRIAIVDDVMTTTATANEAARSLKKAGAKHVELWLIARTEKARFI